MKPGVNEQAAPPLLPERSQVPAVVDALKPGVQKWLAVACCGYSAFPSPSFCSCGQWDGCTRSIMQTLWQVMLTGMGVVMITTTIAVIIGLCVLLWWTHRID